LHPSPFQSQFLSVQLIDVVDDIEPSNGPSGYQIGSMLFVQLNIASAEVNTSYSLIMPSCYRITTARLLHLLQGL
jgi:hypothetical protein